MAVATATVGGMVAATATGVGMVAATDTEAAGASSLACVPNKRVSSLLACLPARHILLQLALGLFFCVASSVVWGGVM